MDSLKSRMVTEEEWSGLVKDAKRFKERHEDTFRRLSVEARAERGRRKAEASGQSPEGMISDLLDKAAGED